MAIRRLSNSSIATGAKSSRLWDGETFPGYFESIATITGDSSSGVITFSNIPSIYQHLQIRLSILSTATYNYLRFNSDSGSNYSWHQLSGHLNANTASGTNQNLIYITQQGGSSTVPSSTIIDILDYKNTSKNTTVRSVSGVDGNGSGLIYFRSGAWYNTAAINTISLTLDSDSYRTGSIAALYGIRGA